MEDNETSADSPKRPSAIKFLERSDSKDNLDYDSSQECDSPGASTTGNHNLMMSMRAHSPSPIRKHGSLLDLFDTMTTNGVSMTQGLTNMAQ